ncbi:broad specificity phosphatase PhoE [Corynebacterium mucifaciens]|uniref:histidine phosphatase family protein n=1 Tax=Corynebacterium ureicelerivorans TaxID=401472 RepID=UPI0023571906|nr:histidine phosphatase family protein [Corynebacterium ureicelerivorans]MCT1369986.1 histidine phosphatase family protein [Corynebacterium mucifaciens]MDN8627223.1 histidine phosphatase family protein [Corynebacterium ureicelerivorans]
MARTTVHLVRHGEVYNPKKILYGRMPGYHLSSRGNSMAVATSKFFRGRDVTYLAASPLERAQETARPIAEVTGCEVQTREDILEAGNTFEGLRTKGWRSQLINPVRWRHMTNPLEPSWGEPYQEIFQRMWGAVEDARDTAEGHEAVLVSHQLPIVMVQRHVQGKPLAHASRNCDLASVTSLVFDGGDVVDWAYTTPAQHI